MTNELGKYVPLKTIVSYFLDETDKSYKDFDKAWIIALRGLVDMEFDVSGEPKTLRIPLNGNKTITIPPDCISWTKIGILDENGQINTLKINTGLTTYMDNNPARVSKLEDVQVNDSIGILSSSRSYLNFFQNGSYGQLFGIGNGLVQHGECRIDTKNNVVIFPPNFAYDSVLFEYISSPERDEDYKVELVMQEALIAFIKWKFKLGTMQEYYGMIVAGRRRLSNKKVTLQRIAQVLREDNGFKLQS